VVVSASLSAQYRRFVAAAIPRGGEIEDVIRTSEPDSMNLMRGSQG
jgi:hypothetical protein